MKMKRQREYEGKRGNLCSCSSSRILFRSQWMNTIPRLSFEHHPSTIGENRQLVTNEPVEFEKYPVEIQDCTKITDHFKGIYRIYSNLIKENRRMSTCNRLDLQTLGSQTILPKNLPDHCHPLNMRTIY
jgi:hypothetical protein